MQCMYYTNTICYSSHITVVLCITIHYPSPSPPLAPPPPLPSPPPQVYMKALTSKDLFIIAHSLHPTLSASLIKRMIKFNKKVCVCVCVASLYVYCTSRNTMPEHHFLLGSVIAGAPHCKLVKCTYVYTSVIKCSVRNDLSLNVLSTVQMSFHCLEHRRSKCDCS